MQKAVKAPGRPTTTMAIVTLEDVPVLSDAEKMSLVASLKQAEAEAAAGAAKPFNRPAFKKRFLALCAGKET